jgi:NhaP-type Na+/H+ or K+/H+ antiporter
LFRKSIVNIIILAVPGVIIGSLLFAFVLRSILGYTDADMTWYQALTLGCALSSTDPVAVVTLLKELGSSGRFNTLIEGESLISGAVSMILYYLFLDVANG